MSESSTSANARLFRASCAPFPELFHGPAAPGFEYRVYPGTAAAIAGLAAGEVDLIDSPVATAGPLPDGVVSHPCEIFGYHSVAFNCAAAGTSDVRVRRALACLWDRAARQAAEAEADAVTIMPGLVADWYGRIANPFVTTYQTADDRLALNRARAELGNAGRPGSLLCLLATDDDLVARTASSLRAMAAELGIAVSVRQTAAGHSAELGAADWHMFVSFEHIQDNMNRWNPGMHKLRWDVDWLTDFQSGNSSTRNYPRLRDEEYDRVSRAFLSSLEPNDIRASTITVHHLDARWNNQEFWVSDAEVDDSDSAVLLAWKLQHIISEKVPVLPLFMPHRPFLARASLAGIWNGDPIEATPYPGGILSFWTYQRAHHAGDADRPVRLGLTAQPRGFNPLTANRWSETQVWCRIYESLLGLNPILAEKRVAEDSMVLASAFTSELVTVDGEVRQRLRFRIRDGAQWHDGTRLTAADVAFSFLSVLGPEGRSISRRHASTQALEPVLVNDVPVPSWVDLLGGLDHIELGDLTVECHLRRVSRYSHQWFGDLPIIPLHVWRHLGPDFTRPDITLTRPDALVGTGPFAWDASGSRSPAEGGRLQAFSAYHSAVRPSRRLSLVGGTDD
jgi:ABC-type transport system substrate-binding protein